MLQPLIKVGEMEGTDSLQFANPSEHQKTSLTEVKKKLRATEPQGECGSFPGRKLGRRQTPTMKDKPVMEKTFNEDLDVEKLLREGGVHARLYLEVQGNDKEASKKALERVVFDQMAGEKDVYLLSAKMYDIVKDGDSDVFSGVVEVEMVSRDFRWFINTLMRYGPTAIEIIEPEEITLSSDEMHSLVADISEMAQVYSNQIMSLLKDEERVALYNKLLAEQD